MTHILPDRQQPQREWRTCFLADNCHNENDAHTKDVHIWSGILFSSENDLSVWRVSY